MSGLPTVASLVVRRAWARAAERARLAQIVVDDLAREAYRVSREDPARRARAADVRATVRAVVRAVDDRLTPAPRAHCYDVRRGQRMARRST